ncbi:MAG: PIN domain-containing protein [Mitsuaria chitosanitabida]|nr:PIN domain-containing protein [Roseateles chitosanitabidus]
MSAIDTNVLVRFIVQDDSNQAEAVERLRRRHAHHDVRLFVSTTVILELEWVLRACFKFDKLQVLGAFVRIIELFRAPDRERGGDHPCGRELWRIRGGPG